MVLKKKVLFLTAANPMGIGGGCFASHAYLRAFSDIYEGRVDVVMADSWEENWDVNIKIENYFVAKPLTKSQGLALLRQMGYLIKDDNPPPAID